ncbi:MAG: F-type H+-transporting ATPase subunit b [Verrucomicrobiales bacterium]|jgi:F-type H+-transporting ATPase subunit b
MDQIGEILSNLGVTWPKFIAQIIIFLLVYTILKKFAFGPITAILDERRKRIEENEADREKIKAQLVNSESAAAAKIAEANEAATRMIAEAKESAVVVAEKEKQNATKEAQDIVSKAREATKLEREQQLASLKSDFGKLVISATGKVTGKVLSSEDQEKINKETATQLAS